MMESSRVITVVLLAIAVASFGGMAMHGSTMEQLSIVREDLDRLEQSLIKMGENPPECSCSCSCSIPEEGDVENKENVFYVRDVDNLIVLEKVDLYRPQLTTYKVAGREYNQYVVEVGCAGFMIGDEWLNIDVQPGDVVYPIVSDGPPFTIQYRVCSTETGCQARVDTGVAVEYTPESLK